MNNEERVHFKIAIPLSLKQRLEHESIENRRSLSAEIIARLEDSLPPEYEEGEILSRADRAIITEAANRITSQLSEKLALANATMRKAMLDAIDEENKKNDTDSDK